MIESGKEALNRLTKWSKAKTPLVVLLEDFNPSRDKSQFAANFSGAISSVNESLSSVTVKTELGDTHLILFLDEASFMLQDASGVPSLVQLLIVNGDSWRCTFFEKAQSES